MSDSGGQKFSWIAEVEREEEEEKERVAAAAAAACLGQGPAAFPTIVEALSSITPKKKAPGTYGYGYGYPELPAGGSGRYVGPGRSSSGLTANEMLMLPTGPRDRSDEDFPPPGTLGGGFRDYGANSRGGSGGRDRNERDGERGFGSGFDNSSRADDSSNWGMNKAYRSTVPTPPPSSRPREENLNKDFTSSRADEVSSWSSLKKPATVTPTPDFRRQPDEHSREGFDENRFATPRPPERRFGSGFVESLPRDSGSESERWSKRELPPPPLMREDTLRRQAIPNQTDERQYAPPPPSQPKPKPSPFGSARPREEVLANRALDPTEYAPPPPPLPLLPKERDSRPSSSHSSRSTTPEVKSEPPSKPRPKVNPFGAARPREEVLQEKGKDWRKIDFDLEHRSVDRPETEPERILKEEINALNLLLKQDEAEGGILKKLNGSLADNKGEGDSKAGGDAENRRNSLKDELLQKEKELWQLTWALDDKVRFSQGGGERPGSRSSRGGESGRSVDSSLERPGSRSGLDSVVDRPGSQSGRESVERMIIGSSSSRMTLGGHEGRLNDTYERANSSGGRRGDAIRNFDSAERSGPPYGPGVVVGRSNVHSERVGLLQSQGFAYPPQGRVADIWTRSGEESGRDERRSRGGRW